jgi:hypothetical protein
MNKETFNPHIAQIKRERFVQGAVAEDVLDKIEMSERDQNIGILTTFSEMPYYQIGALYLNPKTGESLKLSRIEQIYKKFLRKAYEVSSLGLQSSCSLEEILTTRPPLLKNGSASSKIDEVIKEEGITDPKQLQERTGLNSQGLGNARSTLKNRGVDVPLSQAYPDFKRKIAQEDDFEKLQQILDDYRDKLQGFLDHNRNDKNGTLASLFSIVKLAGLDLYPTSKNIELILNSLKKNEKTVKLPLEIVILKSKARSLIVLSKHKNIIIDVLQNDPRLHEYKQNQDLIFTNNEIFAIIQRLTYLQTNNPLLLKKWKINMNCLDNLIIRKLMDEIFTKTQKNPSYRQCIVDNNIESAYRNYAIFIRNPGKYPEPCREAAQALVNCFGNKNPGKRFWREFKAVSQNCSRTNGIKINI